VLAAGQRSSQRSEWRVDAAFARRATVRYDEPVVSTVASWPLPALVAVFVTALLVLGSAVAAARSAARGTELARLSLAAAQVARSTR
jgi:hypothetical protein